MALRRLSTPQAREVAQFLENPVEAPQLFDHAPATAGALMATEFSKVRLGDQDAGFPIRSKKLRYSWAVELNPEVGKGLDSHPCRSRVSVIG